VRGLVPGGVITAALVEGFFQERICCLVEDH